MASSEADVQNGWKIELEWYRNGDGIPFAKHPATGSYMRIAVIPRQRRRGVRLLSALIEAWAEIDPELPVKQSEVHRLVSE